MLIVKNGHGIASVDDWRRLAPPKRPDQWVAGRSAYECSVAWCGTGVAREPEEIRGLLDSHADIRGCEVFELTPEHPVRFDRRRGDPRNADIAARARDSRGEIAVSIEAKADEPFDRPIQEMLGQVVDTLAHGGRTNLGSRIQDLAASILPARRGSTPRLGDLRYQLLTGVAGAIAQAQALRADRALFITHEFITDRTDDERLARNAADLDAFVCRVTDGAHRSVATGHLLGPVVLPAGPLWEQPARLYIGKARRLLRRTAE